MSGSLTPGVNAPTLPPPIPGIDPLTAPQPQGLINSAPQLAPTSPLAPAAAPGTPAATIQPPTTPPTTPTPPPVDINNPTPSAFTVSPDQTVSHQISNIIASGSPLMQQAEANARNLMNQRGLINSSMGVTAGQSALYTAATPIAAADAATYDKAQTNTINAQNAAKLQTQQIAGQTNIAEKQIAGQENIANIQTESAQKIAKLQSDTSMTVQDKVSETSKWISQLQSDTSLTNQQKQNETTLAVQNMQSQVQTYLGNLQSSTQLSVADKAAQASTLQTQMNNTTQLRLGQIQADTTLSVTEQQTRSAQVIAEANNANARTIQGMVNAGALENIKANGVINTQIQKMGDDNKTLLQTSAGAANLYSQTLQGLSAIVQNKDMNTQQQADASNNLMKTLNDAFGVLKGINNSADIKSNLVFGGGSGGGGDGGGASSPNTSPPSPGAPNGTNNSLQPGATTQPGQPSSPMPTEPGNWVNTAGTWYNQSGGG